MSHEVWAAASWHSQMILTFWVVQCCVSGTPLAQAERRWTKPRMLMIGLFWSHFEQIFAVVAQSISNVGTPNFWKSDWPLIYSGQLSNLHWTWAWLDVLWGHLEEFRTNVDLDLELDKWGKQRFRPLFYFQYQAYLHHHEWVGNTANIFTLDLDHIYGHLDIPLVHKEGTISNLGWGSI